ncbi:MAG: DUF6596 domain-containing protein [Pseudomonadota bacterium]
MSEDHERSHEDVRRTLDRITRRERGRLIAGLVSYLGADQVALAEDVAQEAVLKALASWPYAGLPRQPGAWLATVARRCAIDRLRREQREAELEDTQFASTETTEDFPARVADPELRLMLLCCDEVLSAQDRVGLTLRLVGGFTSRDIAQVLLAGESATAQRLTRARRRLRGYVGLADAPLGAEALSRRLPSVCKTLYLMFSLGYAPRSGETVVRSDVALEAVRLAEGLLTHAPAGQTRADCAALTALLSLQASRLQARADTRGALVLLRDQDRSKWDRSLITRGLTLLATQARGTEHLSRYHVEASIAAAHATAPTWEACDWPLISRHYGLLEQMTTSPVVRINANVARAMAGAPVAALANLRALEEEPALAHYAPYYLALAETARLAGDRQLTAREMERALACELSAPVAADVLERLLEMRADD